MNEQAWIHTSKLTIIFYANLLDWFFVILYISWSFVSSLYSAQSLHLIRPDSSQLEHFRATNSSVKSLRWTDFLEPLQTEQGSKRKPPHTLQNELVADFLYGWRSLLSSPHSFIRSIISASPRYCPSRKTWGTDTPLEWSLSISCSCVSRAMKTSLSSKRTRRVQRILRILRHRS